MLLEEQQACGRMEGKSRINHARKRNPSKQFLSSPESLTVPKLNHGSLNIKLAAMCHFDAAVYSDYYSPDGGKTLILLTAHFSPNP